jgi:hypothetical protein
MYVPQSAGILIKNDLLGFWSLFYNSITDTSSFLEPNSQFALGTDSSACESFIGPN